MQKILGFVGIGVSALTLLLAILALSLKYWETSDQGGVADVNIGLWEFCIDNSVTKVCTTINSDSVTDEELKNYRAVRATLLIGILLNTGAIVTAILVLFVLKEKKILFFVAAGLDIAAGLFYMIAMAVYADKVAHNGYDFHASFALDIVAWIAAWVAGGAFAGAKLLDKD